MFFSATNFFEPESLASFAVTMIAVLINLGIMYWVVKRFLYKPLRKFLDERQRKANEEMTKAQALAAESQASLAANKAAIESAHDEAALILADTRKRAAEEYDEIIARAQQEADKLLQTSAQHSAELRLTVLQHLHGDISNIILETMEAVLDKVLQDEDQEALVQAELERRLHGMMQPTASEHAAAGGSVSHDA